jgi:hypothetical protein
MKLRFPVEVVSVAASLSAFVVGMCLCNTRALGQTAESRIEQTPIKNSAWLAGDGKDLRVRVTGAVFDESGAPSNDCKLVVVFKTEMGTTKLPAVIEGNRFHVLVPVGDVDWFIVHLNATSADGRRVAWEKIARFHLRQAAINGLKLILKPPERIVEVAVAEKAMPSPGRSPYQRCR